MSRDRSRRGEEPPKRRRINFVWGEKPPAPIAPTVRKKKKAKKANPAQPAAKRKGRRAVKKAAEKPLQARLVETEGRGRAARWSRRAAVVAVAGLAVALVPAMREAAAAAASRAILVL